MSEFYDFRELSYLSQRLFARKTYKIQNINYKTFFIRQFKF